MVDELDEGVHRGEGNVVAEVELEECDRIIPVILGQVFLEYRVRDKGLLLSSLPLEVS